MKLMLSLAVVFALTAFACSRQSDREAARQQSVAEGEAWLLAGTVDDRFVRVARHLRGFDVAMVETGQRYAELYWAGQDRNWEYARYQLDKIRIAVENGVERRPKRAASAQMLEGALPGVESAIEARDPRLFAQCFEVLTQTCNKCHEQERVPFVHVQPPSQRLSPVAYGSGAGR